MAEPARVRVVRELARRGLASTLLVTSGQAGHTIGRVQNVDGDLALASVAHIPPVALPVVGRIGPPHPQLMPMQPAPLLFYGKWFDEIGETDPGYQLRRTISNLATSRLLEQVARDDRYALVAEFGAVFRAVMEKKRRVPLVLLAEDHLALESFPVVLPVLPDAEVEQRLLGILHIMLKARTVSDHPAPDAPASGIDVHEIDDH